MRLGCKVDKLDGLSDLLSGVADQMLTAGVAAARLPVQAAMKETFGSMGGAVVGQTASGRNVYEPAPPGSPPGVRTGYLRRSIQFSEVINYSADIGTNLAYGYFLEYGTDKMRARPWTHRALNKARRPMEQAATAAMERVFYSKAAEIAAKAGGA
jgi:hypothetical protein